MCVTLSPNPGDRQKVLRVKYYIPRPALLPVLSPPTASHHAGDLIAQTRAEEQELATRQAGAQLPMLSFPPLSTCLIDPRVYSA